MKVMVIGGTGHVGGFMVPMLIEAGCEVVVVGSGRTRVRQDGTWAKVKYIACDTMAGENFDELIQEKPEVIIDMPGTVWAVSQQFKKIAKHIIACGSVWMYGDPKVVPTPESTQNPCKFEAYARRYKELLQLIEQSTKDGLAFTAIMPPNICGPGKIPIECLGGRDIEIHKQHIAGVEVVLPDGAEALIGPCDAEDIARCFVKATVQREKAAGEMFNVGSAYALTASELVGAFETIYNVNIPIRKVSWQEYIEKISPGMGRWWHFKSHMCPDISKASRLLGYEPKYTPEQTLGRAVDWMHCEKLT